MRDLLEFQSLLKDINKNIGYEEDSDSGYRNQTQTLISKIIEELGHISENLNRKSHYKERLQRAMQQNTEQRRIRSQSRLNDASPFKRLNLPHEDEEQPEEEQPEEEQPEEEQPEEEQPEWLTEAELILKKGE
jgi:hypothetical protein